MHQSKGVLSIDQRHVSPRQVTGYQIRERREHVNERLLAARRLDVLGQLETDDVVLPKTVMATIGRRHFRFEQVLHSTPRSALPTPSASCVHRDMLRTIEQIDAS